MLHTFVFGQEHANYTRQQTKSQTHGNWYQTDHPVVNLIPVFRVLVVENILSGANCCIPDCCKASSNEALDSKQGEWVRIKDCFLSCNFFLNQIHHDDLHQSSNDSCHDCIDRVNDIVGGSWWGYSSSYWPIDYISDKHAIVEDGWNWEWYHSAGCQSVPYWIWASVEGIYSDLLINIICC